MWWWRLGGLARALAWLHRGRRRYGRYRIEAIVHGPVHVARALDRRGEEGGVALKLPRPATASAAAAVSRELAAVDVLKHLRHEHLALPTGRFRVLGQDVIVMELVAHATTLGAFGEVHGGRLGDGGVAAIGVEILRGLSALHGLADPAGEPLGIVHRDLSSGNVLLAPDGTIKLVDFGLAWPRAARAHWRYGPLGSPAYMSPEQIDLRDLDARSDLHAVGSLLYELLAGKPPFEQRDDVAATWDAVRAGAPKRIPGVSDGLWEIIERALAVEPAKRPASADEMAAALETCLSRTLSEHRAERAALMARRRNPLRQTMAGTAPLAAAGMSRGMRVMVVGAPSALAAAGLLWLVIGRDAGPVEAGSNTASEPEPVDAGVVQLDAQAAPPPPPRTARAVRPAEEPRRRAIDSGLAGAADAGAVPDAAGEASQAILQSSLFVISASTGTTACHLTWRLRGGAPEAQLVLEEGRRGGEGAIEVSCAGEVHRFGAWLERGSSTRIAVGADPFGSAHRGIPTVPFIRPVDAGPKDLVLGFSEGRAAVRIKGDLAAGMTLQIGCTKEACER